MDYVRELFSTELGYVALLFTLFVVPRIIQRWRIPTAITSMALGAVAGMGFGLLHNDATLHLLASFGIVALFLFAGLDVSAHDLQREWRVLVQHLAVRFLMVVGAAWAVQQFLGLALRPATLVALALLTPSTGFILDSLGRFGLTGEEQFWVKGKAIATELLALVILFFTLQSASPQRLVGATLAMAAIVAVLPILFRFFTERVAPYAPKSEFAFLLMLALLCAYATRRLGAYYLVGAFVVGIAARRFRDKLPAIASDQMIHAVEVFATFFVPFYFFTVGTELRRTDFSPLALVLGVVFLMIFGPLRMLSIATHRRLVLGEQAAHSLRVALPMLPTLVFTLVLAAILRDDFGVPQYVFGGLIVYTLLNTLVPGMVFGVPAPALEPAPMPPPIPLPATSAAPPAYGVPAPRTTPAGEPPPVG